jgi:hypothetical protein
MEVVSSCGAVDYLHVDPVLLGNVLVVTTVWNGVILITELQVPLETSGGVLGTLAIVTVGKEHDEAVVDIPFGFS